jgi:hypothetical protein
MFITCDLYYLKDNYILHFRGNDITSKFIEDAKNKNITRVAIKDNEISYDCDCFKPIFLTVFIDNKVYRDKIGVFDKHNHVEQFQETYDRLFGKQDNISKNSSNKTNNKVKLWQKVFLILIKNCMLFMTRLKKQVEK